MPRKERESAAQRERHLRRQMQKKIAAPAEQKPYQNIVRVVAAVLSYHARENSRRDEKSRAYGLSICDFVQRPFLEALRNHGTKINSSPAAIPKHILNKVDIYLISRRPNSFGSSRV